MQFGVYVPTSNEYNVNMLAVLAIEAEAAGWEGFFIWDNIMATFDGSGVLADTTVALTAIALATERIRFGALVTPLARRRPWKVAKETATLDGVSGGRLVFGAGLGGRWDMAPVGEFGPAGQRARLLDESLDILASLWSGNPVSHSGESFVLEAARTAPRPVQRPRIPVWIAGHWPLHGPFQRAARWDGVVPIRAGRTFEGLTPAEIRKCIEFISAHRDSASPFDVIFFHRALGRDISLVAEYEEAGATWWLESTFPLTETTTEFRIRINAGPPC
jgi:alkanesulfonate monooxygenase SsuD/methylene tetrahydromethanopterin reductase-like flavin-dependent oxidoreductase (luciferase family)